MFWGLFLPVFDLSPGVRVTFRVGVINMVLGGGNGNICWVAGGNCVVENNCAGFSVISVGMGIRVRLKRGIGISAHVKVAGSGGDDGGMFFHVSICAEGESVLLSMVLVLSVSLGLYVESSLLSMSAAVLAL